jgi:hypothetical protein
MALNNITVPSVPKTSINLQLKVGLGVNQILSPVSAYNVNYVATDSSQVEQRVIRLAPSSTYTPPNNNDVTQLLIINTNKEIQLEAVTNSNALISLVVNKICVIDSPLKNYNLTNVGSTTALVTLNVYATMVNSVLELTYQGSGLDTGVYDADFINTLNVAGHNLANAFTVNVLPNQYSWYAYATNLGIANFQVNGFTGGYELIASNINLNGVLYTLYRSDNSGLGVMTVNVF